MPILLDALPHFEAPAIVRVASHAVSPLAAVGLHTVIRPQSTVQGPDVIGRNPITRLQSTGEVPNIVGPRSTVEIPDVVGHSPVVRPQSTGQIPDIIGSVPPVTGGR
jgi:hypothetical protein